MRFFRLRANILSMHRGNSWKPSWWDEQDKSEALLLAALEREQQITIANALAVQKHSRATQPVAFMTTSGTIARQEVCQQEFNALAARIPTETASETISVAFPESFPFGGSKVLLPRLVGVQYLGAGWTNTPAPSLSNSQIFSKGSTISAGGIYREVSDDLAQLDSLCSAASTVCSTTSSLSWTVSAPPSLTTPTASTRLSGSLSAGPTSSWNFPAGTFDSHRAKSAPFSSATERQHRCHPYQRPAAADNPKWPRHRTEKTGKCIDKDIFQDLKSPTLPKALLNCPALSSAECDDSEWTVGPGNPYSI